MYLSFLVVSTRLGGVSFKFNDDFNLIFVRFSKEEINVGHVYTVKMYIKRCTN